jgi:hypothetical protein
MEKYLYALAVAFCVSITGCAHGSDGAYQAESVANGFIGAGYRAVKAHARAESDAVKTLAKTDAVAAQKRLDAEVRLTGAAFKALDVASDNADELDASIAVAEAAKQKDYGAIISKLLSIGAAVADTLKTLGISLPGVK